MKQCGFHKLLIRPAGASSSWRCDGPCKNFPRVLPEAPEFAVTLARWVKRDRALEDLMRVQFHCCETNKLNIQDPKKLVQPVHIWKLLEVTGWSPVQSLQVCW